MKDQSMIFGKADMAGRLAILILLAAAFGLIPESIALESSRSDRIVAIVNDDIIVLSELEKELKPYRDRLKALGYTPEKEKELLYEVRENLLNQLIDEELAGQEIAKSEDITVTFKEVEDAIEEVKKQSYLTDEELREALAQEGMTIEQYADNIRDEILRGKLISQKVRSQVIITQEDIRGYYDRHKDKYGGKTKYHLRHILMRPSALDDERGNRSIRRRMDGILADLRSGQDFEALARIHSESPTADAGGDLGTLSLDTLSDQIRTAVADLKPGHHTEIIDTDQGHQIFLLQDIIEEPGTPIGDVTPEIEQALYNEIVDRKYREWIESLRSQAHIKIIR